MPSAPYPRDPSFSTFRGLVGKNVLVTGGSSGIGQAIAIRFGYEGANVAVNYYRDRADAETTRAQLHEARAERVAAFGACAERLRSEEVRVMLHQADVSDAHEVHAMFERAVAHLGGLDVLVNNAGIQLPSPSHETSAAEFDKVLAVNLRGAFLCAKEAIGHFLEQEKPGVIINVSSVHQVIPKPKYVGYSVSKGGMQNLTRTLALEYAGRGIRVNGLGPGATVTPINRAWTDDPAKRAEVERHIPMGRAAAADEMAAVTAFLASDEAAYITGQTLFVDGGLTLYPDFRTAWSSE